VRILKSLGVKPRRTIRIALWDAEEEGLIGSRGYVANHFFDREKKEKKPEYDKLAAYFNYDNGSGKIRGIYTQGNFEVMPIFEQWLKPFNDLGASTVTFRNTGGTDHQSYDGVGLPGFQFIQDELEYDTRTHHSNMDVYDHTVRADLIQSATIMAAFVYNAAMRDEKLPRKYFDPNTVQQRRPMF
ncbi:MAG: M28 family peptidase, partial [Ignavibacteria bacterium]|nr:M28 family peptidase [Ignavibacteria bacterium]